MTDYRTIDPVIIDSVACDDIALTSAFPLFFGSLEQADLYIDGIKAATSKAPLAHGYIMSAIPNPVYNALMYPDESLTIKCYVLYGRPVTCTNDEFLQGKNVAYIGRTGAWEAVYYRDVANNTDGTVTLSHILRGVKGTWVDGYQHAIKDTVVFGNVGLEKITRPNTDLNKIVVVKIVPSGADYSLNTGLGGNLTLRGGAIAPWAPVNVHSVRTSGDDVIDWTRVDRAASTMHDGDDFTPLTDTPERYSLGVFKAPWTIGDAPLRTVTGLTAPTWTYTSAARTADGLLAASSYTLLICQDSAVLGHGKPFFGEVHVHT